MSVNKIDVFKQKMSKYGYCCKLDYGRNNNITRIEVYCPEEEKLEASIKINNATEKINLKYGGKPIICNVVSYGKAKKMVLRKEKKREAVIKEEVREAPTIKCYDIKEMFETIKLNKKKADKDDKCIEIEQK